MWMGAPETSIHHVQVLGYAYLGAVPAATWAYPTCTSCQLGAAPSQPLKETKNNKLLQSGKVPSPLGDLDCFQLFVNTNKEDTDMSLVLRHANKHERNLCHQLQLPCLSLATQRGSSMLFSPKYAAPTGTI